MSGKQPIKLTPPGPTGPNIKKATKKAVKKRPVKISTEYKNMENMTPDEKKEFNKARRKASKKASDCVYLLETVLGNMKSIEEDGGKGKYNEIDEIYEMIEDLNLMTIDL